MAAVREGWPKTHVRARHRPTETRCTRAPRTHNYSPPPPPPAALHAPKSAVDVVRRDAGGVWVQAGGGGHSRMRGASVNPTRQLGCAASTGAFAARAAAPKPRFTRSRLVVCACERMAGDDGAGDGANTQSVSTHLVKGNGRQKQRVVLLVGRRQFSSLFPCPNRPPARTPVTERIVRGLRQVFFFYKKTVHSV